MRKFAAAVLAGLTVLTVEAGQAAACTRIVPSRPGETQQQAWDRARREQQDRLFQESASIFAADLVAINTTTRNNRIGLNATIIPFLEIKGRAPSKVIRYQADNAPTGCGDWDFPNFESQGVFFTDDQGSVLGMLNIANLEDPELKARLFEQVDRAQPRTAKDIEHLLNPIPFLHWFVVGGVSLLSLLIGCVLGRAFRPRAKN